MATITTFDAFVTACRTAVTPRVVSVALRTDTDYLTFADDGSTCGPTRKTFAVVGTAYGVARNTAGDIRNTVEQQGSTTFWGSRSGAAAQRATFAGVNNPPHTYG